MKPLNTLKAMAEPSRYNVSARQAGLDKGILKNKLGTLDQKLLEDTETLLLADTYSYFKKRLENQGLKFDLSLLFAIHRYFLQTLYSWAGKISTVNISKDGMLFCPAVH